MPLPTLHKNQLQPQFLQCSFSPQPHMVGKKKQTKNRSQLQIVRFPNKETQKLRKTCEDISNSHPEDINRGIFQALSPLRISAPRALTAPLGQGAVVKGQPIGSPGHSTWHSNSCLAIMSHWAARLGVAGRLRSQGTSRLGEKMIKENVKNQ